MSISRWRPSALWSYAPARPVVGLAVVFMVLALALVQWTSPIAAIDRWALAINSARERRRAGPGGCRNACEIVPISADVSPRWPLSMG